VTRTAALMADSSVPATFEVAYEHSRVRVRIDVLERLPRGFWGIREASSGEVKEHYYDRMQFFHEVMTFLNEANALALERVTMDLFGDPAERDQISPFVRMLWQRVLRTRKLS
jgi:hypothetical protein